MVSNNAIYNITWELEYLSGPKIAFQELFPNQKPTITFDKTKHQITGNSGCNGYSVEFALKENKLTLGEPGPSTLMYCGDGEAFFLKAMQEINQYQFDSEGKLLLMKDEIPLMRFQPKGGQFKSIQDEHHEIYFRSNGTEPFWMLEIGENGIKFSTPEKVVFFPAVTLVPSMDSHVKNYQAQNKSSEMNVLISHTACANEMSGVVSPYTVIINHKNKETKKFMDLKGCGEYLVDYRLHGHWVLETLNGNKINQADFNKNFPSLEINRNNPTFTGFAGCNRMHGSLFFEKGLLQFTDITTTRMLCESTNKEAEFLLDLKKMSTYKVENNRLTLSSKDGETLVFTITDTDGEHK